MPGLLLSIQGLNLEKFEAIALAADKGVNLPPNFALSNPLWPVLAFTINCVLGVLAKVILFDRSTTTKRHEPRCP
jgi:hypothetical protein